MNKALLFRRQFLLTTKEIDNPPVVLAQHQLGKYYVYAHPELNVSQTFNGSKNVHLMLIGFILDPENPKSTDIEILRVIAESEDVSASIGFQLTKYSGRFVLFLNHNDQYYIFHDPCGLRSVFYKREGENIIAGSSTAILKLATKVDDGERLKSYVSSDYVKNNIEHWIPSGCSLYESIEHLVPNHYLQFSSGKQIRYWPTIRLEAIDVDEAAKAVSNVMIGLILAANERFKLAIPMTAGWDSRLILAASKIISGSAFYYTLQYRSLGNDSQDIFIPRRLLKSLSLYHHTLNCKADATEDFIKVYERNTVPSHFNDWGKIAYGMLNCYPQDRVCIKGNCSEIVRCFYYPTGTHVPIDSHNFIIGLENGWSEIPFVIDKIEKWFSEAHNISENFSIDILDLFYWEHRMGSWQSQSQLEWDIAQEAFTPYNHRGLLETMLATPTSMRNAPNYKLYRTIIRQIWPEALSQPINGLSRRQRIKNIMLKVSRSAVPSFIRGLV